MCYYCHILGHNIAAPPHHSKNCLDSNNTYSKKNTNGQTAQTTLTGLTMKYCKKCKCTTSHCWQQNNGYETPWLRCMGDCN